MYMWRPARWSIRLGLQSCGGLKGLSTSENLAFRRVVPRGHDGSYSLDDERDYIEEYEVKAKPPGFEAQNIGAGGEVVHHSAQDHINICVYPEWC